MNKCNFAYDMFQCQNINMIVGLPSKDWATSQYTNHHNILVCEMDHEKTQYIALIGKNPAKI